MSGWTDIDKEGRRYRDYFVNAASYSITNYPGDKDRGAQGSEGELCIDLEQPLPSTLHKRFDVAFCHTVLEHVFEVRLAFANICRMARAAVITVVPYVQQVHGFNDAVGDYWRFTPFTMQRLYGENQLKLRYCSANGESPNASIYLFAIGYANDILDDVIPERFDLALDASRPPSAENVIGAHLIR